MTRKKNKPLIGSPAFDNLWQEWRENDVPKQVLANLMSYVGMPTDLSGQLEETQHLLAIFAPDLAPHHQFWKDVVRVVNQAFPNSELSRQGLLQRQIHQFRYLISSQQAQYVRTHHKKPGMTDQEALVDYLKWKPFTLFDQGRLHQKIAIRKGQPTYPDGQPSINLKILLYNRIEFILDSQGHFLNEVDAEVLSESGVVNGASFNYGSFKRHWDLDVDPVGPHDPIFRNRMCRGFRSPNKVKKYWWQSQAENFDRSFYNAKGIYAQSSVSLWRDVKKAGRFFRYQVWRARLDRR